MKDPLDLIVVGVYYYIVYCFMCWCVCARLWYYLFIWYMIYTRFHCEMIRNGLMIVGEKSCSSETTYGAFARIITSYIMFNMFQFCSRYHINMLCVCVNISSLHMVCQWLVCVCHIFFPLTSTLSHSSSLYLSLHLCFWLASPFG